VRTYELALVADPRISDDDFTALSTEYKQLISSRGGEILREESWGRRKLAYPIRKLTEGRYLFLFLQIEPAKAGLLREVELRLNQNDKILRYLTVRTDEDLKRAAGRAKPGEAPPRTGGYYDVDPAAAAAAAAAAEAGATAAQPAQEIASASPAPATSAPADEAAGSVESTETAAGEA
jgi:small subunit ribosomal protein S6